MPLIIVCFLLSSYDTKSFGIFVQTRIGLHKRPFRIFKIKTMYDSSFCLKHGLKDRISRFGLILRKYKFDELPQLFNIFIGDMSFVGPRPEVPEQLISLSSHYDPIFSVRPGLTGPASLKYANEEYILSQQLEPDIYNETVIFPDKLSINLEYIHNKSFRYDILIIMRTIRLICSKLSFA